MSSRRLTSWLRERILTSLLKHRFDEQKQALDLWSQEIANKIYGDVFSEKDRDLMASLPDSWLPTSSHIHCTIGGKYESLSLGVDLPFPEKKRNQCMKVYDGKHPFAKAWLKLQGERMDWSKSRNEAKAAASAILESVTTTGALITKWPEVAPFVPEEEIPEILLAIPLDRVNKLFSLPAKKTKSAGLPARQVNVGEA